MNTAIEFKNIKKSIWEQKLFWKDSTFSVCKG